jgi:hypothetical protein
MYTPPEAQSITRKTLEVPFEVALNSPAVHSEEFFWKLLCDPSPLVGDLTEWSRLSNARRGLEQRVVGSSIRNSTTAKRRKAVLSSPSQGCASLAELAQALSQPFSRMLGFGDAIVVEETPEHHAWMKKKKR